MKNKPLFIAFDGPNGSGKTTLIKKLKRKLISKNFQVVVTRPLSESPFSELNSTNFEIFLDKYSRANLFSLDRDWRIENIIKPNLNNGIIVIADRYIASSYVYQTLDGCKLKYIKEINRNAIYPDIYIFLECDLDIKSERISKRRTISKFENIQFQKMENDLFKNSRRLISILGITNLCVDTNVTIEKSFEIIFDRVMRLL